MVASRKRPSVVVADFLGVLSQGQIQSSSKVQRLFVENTAAYSYGSAAARRPPDLIAKMLPADLAGGTADSRVNTCSTMSYRWRHAGTWHLDSKSTSSRGPRGGHTDAGTPRQLPRPINPAAL